MSSCSRSYSHHVRTCNRGLDMPILRAWTKDNPRRRFMACRDYDVVQEVRGCRLFKWVNDLQTDWQKQVILRLMEDEKQLAIEVGALTDKLIEANQTIRGLISQNVMLN